MINSMFCSMLLMGLGYSVRFGGRLAMAGLVLGGIYVLFAKSIVIGLVMISAAGVGVWIFEFISRRLISVGIAVNPLGIYEELPKNPSRASPLGRAHRLLFHD